VRTRMNSMSNVPLAIAGLAIISVVKIGSKNSSVQNHLRQAPILSYTFAAMLIWLGFGSFVNHAFRTRMGRELDRAAAGSYAGAFCSLSVIRFVPMTALPASRNRFYLLYSGALWAVSMLFLLFFILLGETHLQAAHVVFFGFTNVSWIVSITCYATRPILSGRARCCCKSKLPQLQSYHRWILLGVFWGFCGLMLWYPEQLFNGFCSDIDGPWLFVTHGYFHMLLAMASFCVWWYGWTEHEVDETAHQTPQASDRDPVSEPCTQVEVIGSAQVGKHSGADADI